MGFCGIPSQLKKFLFLIGNETGWDEIYQSHSRPAYVILIKKCLTPIPKFFYRTKIYPIPSGKIAIPSVYGDKYKQIIFLVEIENWDNPL